MHRYRRVFGFALLIGGFLWLLLGAIAVGPRSRVAALEMLSHFDDKGSYSGKYVNSVFRHKAGVLLGIIPWIIPPAVMMLYGGVLLDIARGQTNDNIRC